MASPITPYIDWKREDIKRKLLELMRQGARTEDIARHFGKNMSTILAAICKHTSQTSQNNWRSVRAERQESFWFDPTFKTRYTPEERVCQGHDYAFYLRQRCARRVNESVPIKTGEKPLYSKSLE